MSTVEATKIDLNVKGKTLMKLYDAMKEKIMTEEYRVKNHKGVTNLSRADLEMTVMYIEQLIKNNGYGFSPLVGPHGNIEKLFMAYKLL